MKITLHRGADRVGGNCVEVAYDGTRIALDVGLPLFGENREQLDTLALRRQPLASLREEGVLPPVAGLFRDGGDDDRPDAILLSHAHLDHTGLLGHVHDAIPVYASRGSSKMMLAGSLFARQTSIPRERFRELVSERPVTIGALTVTAYDVDHAIHGSMGFLIEAGGESVFYTGDLRLHGVRREEMERLIGTLRERRIDRLLVEGTCLGLPPRSSQTESEVAERIESLVASAEGLVLACLSPQHADRLAAFYRAAQRSGRVLAVDLYTALVMHLVASESELPRPTPANGVRVFVPELLRRKRGPYAHLLRKIGVEATPLRELISTPERCVVVFRDSMLDSDFAGILPAKTLCLFGQWGGYLDQPGWRQVQAALDEAGGGIEEVHASGHLLESDLTEFVRRASPREVVPIHTFEPQRLAELARGVLGSAG